jgi:hypothetical protein
MDTVLSLIIEGTDMVVDGDTSCYLIAVFTPTAF